MFEIGVLSRDKHSTAFCSLHWTIVGFFVNHHLICNETSLVRVERYIKKIKAKIKNNLFSRLCWSIFMGVCDFSWGDVNKCYPRYGTDDRLKALFYSSLDLESSEFIRTVNMNWGATYGSMGGSNTSGSLTSLGSLEDAQQICVSEAPCIASEPPVWRGPPLPSWCYCLCNFVQAPCESCNLQELLESPKVNTTETCGIYLLIISLPRRRNSSTQRK